MTIYICFASLEVVGGGGAEYTGIIFVSSDRDNFF
jgi:hypothetical protein